MSNATAYIKINGTRLYLTSNRSGRAQTADGISEQCQDCGNDITETGRVRKGGEVECECGTVYQIHGTW